MNWQQELTLICLTLIAGRAMDKWLGDYVVTALIGVGLAVVIAFRIRDYLRSKRPRDDLASP
ncbi:hypothetical protein GCM10009115_03900 [Sphingopyxis soli]|jgi:uncharacterized membrane protein|uniref:AtpZ/AtpI family protein n=1 Tax=Sphingopyxis soli TaxID=592051 RepID=A0ABN1LWY3_9SPHN